MQAVVPRLGLVHRRGEAAGDAVADQAHEIGLGGGAHAGLLAGCGRDAAAPTALGAEPLPVAGRASRAVGTPITVHREDAQDPLRTHSVNTDATRWKRIRGATEARAPAAAPAGRIRGLLPPATLPLGAEGPGPPRGTMGDEACARVPPTGLPNCGG
ncbi:hypothetical protein GCM10009696_27670 [Kocuria himachalensis]